MPSKFLALFLVTSLCLSSCSLTWSLTQKNILRASDGDKLYAVTAITAPFYKYGPQQANGADQRLPRDTLMKLVRPSFGYAKVLLTTGEEGYVANDDIKLAPPALIASLNTPPPGVLPAVHGERFNLESTDPRLAVPPEDLPENNPEPTPIPGTSPN